MSQGSVMEKIVWSDSFSVDDELLDAQHKKIVGLINELIDLHSMVSLDKFKVIKLLQRFQHLAQFHFESEERYLANNGYPALDEHSAVHSRYADQIFDYYRGELSEKTFHDMAVMLSDWWFQHILIEDIAYRDYFREQSDK